MDLSIVIPIKDEKDNIRRLHDRITKALSPLAPSGRGVGGEGDTSYEIVLVDDGSSDGTHGELEAIAAVDGRVKVVRLRRNYGQAAAMQAGIDYANGDVIVTMDGDLQNDPADIPMLIDVLQKGNYDA